ncbi:MAG: hypothetical protein ACR2LC_06935 [Pyrinomonadaceae bacterium]
MTKQEVADLIESFLNGTCGIWEWDDFISLTHKDPMIEAVSVRCASIPSEFPPLEKGHYCGTGGEVKLKQIAQSLR